ncbi:aquaporin-like protein, partial [Polychaeton citri CBS 116435]
KKRRMQFGLEPNREPKEHYEGNEDLLWCRIRQTLQEPFSEFLGILLYTMIAQGGVAQATLSVGEKTAPGGNGFGSYLTVPFVTGIGVMMGVYVAGDSGSYLNPAITIANSLFRGLPWRTLPALTLAQLLGAFVGTAITFGIYKPAIDMYSGGALLVSPTPQATASIFTSFPQTFETRTSQVFSVIQRNAILQIVISALKDDLNLGQRVSAGGGNMFPLNLFFIFFALESATGWETSGQSNPAFDLGSRIMLSCLGYPKEIWTTSGGYPWIPVIMPIVGSCFGAWLYDVFVFTGASPVNTPYLGLSKFAKPSLDYSNRRERYEQRLDEG